jgi:hypothetical protein
MAANAISTDELKVVPRLKDAREFRIVTKRRQVKGVHPLTLKQKLGKLLLEVFEGHEEYVGVTPD